MKKLILVLLSCIVFNISSMAQNVKTETYIISEYKIDSVQYYTNQYNRYKELFTMAADLFAKVHSPKVYEYSQNYYDSTIKYGNLLKRYTKGRTIYYIK